MPTIGSVSNPRALPVRAARLAIEPQNAEDPGILEGTPGSRLNGRPWMGFLSDYRTFWMAADGAAMAEMADKLMLLNSASAQ